MAGTALTIGGLPTGTFGWIGNISEVIVYNYAMSQAQQQQMLAYLNDKWGFSKRMVTCCGNSLTSGTGSSGGDPQVLSSSGAGGAYPNQLWALLGDSGYDVRVDGYSGRSLTQMVSDESVAAIYSGQSRGAPICVVWEITNTLTIKQSAAAAIQLLQTYCKSRQSNGYKVIVLTCLPRGDVIYAGYESDRTVVNDFIRTNYLNFADAVVDVAADNRLQNPLNSVFFNTDKLHLKDAGYAVVASAVASAISKLL
jgi:lysophospholipase L1-like esterase